MAPHHLKGENTMNTKNIEVYTNTEELESGLTLESCAIASMRTGVVIACTRTYSGDTLKVMKAAISDIESGFGWTIKEIVGGQKTCMIALSDN